MTGLCSAEPTLSYSIIHRKFIHPKFNVGDLPDTLLLSQGVHFSQPLDKGDALGLCGCRDPIEPHRYRFVQCALPSPLSPFDELPNSRPWVRSGLAKLLRATARYGSHAHRLYIGWPRSPSSQTNLRFVFDPTFRPTRTKQNMCCWGPVALAIHADASSVVVSMISKYELVGALEKRKVLSYFRENWSGEVKPSRRSHKVPFLQISWLICTAGL
jgi:hypothetical protein